MDHMYDRLSKKGVTMDVSDGGSDGLFDGHKVALRLMQVEAASAQGNCSLALRLLKATREVSRHGVSVECCAVNYSGMHSVDGSTKCPLLGRCIIVCVDAGQLLSTVV